MLMLTCLLLSADCVRADQVSVRNAAEFEKAISRIEAGTDIVLLPGVYEGNFAIADARGRFDQPIRIRAAFLDRPPVLRVGEDGLRLCSVSHVTLQHITVETSHGTGVSIDNGGASAELSTHVALRDVTVRSSSPHSSALGLKCTGVTAFEVEKCRLEKCGIDLINCTDGRMADCVVDGGDVCKTGLSFRCGSRSIVVQGCRFLNIGECCVQIGDDSNAAATLAVAPSAAEIVIEESTFAPARTVFRFMNTCDCLVQRNVVYRPKRCLVEWHPEGALAVATRKNAGNVSENIVVWRSDELQSAISVDPGADLKQFTARSNFWYCEDSPSSSRPPFDILQEIDGVYGEDPRLMDPATYDLRPLRTRDGMRAAARSHASPVWPISGSFLFRMTSGLASMCLLAFAYSCRGARNSWQPVGQVRERDHASVVTASKFISSSKDVLPDFDPPFGKMAVLLFVLFVYGSLVPLNYQSMPFATAVENFRNVPYLALDVYHLADWVANLLLFAPIAYCATARLTVASTNSILRGIAILLVLSALALASVAIEFIQLWFPPRTVSQNDILAESLGVILGAVLAILTARKLVRWLAQALHSPTPEDLFGRLLSVYTFGYVVYALLPLDVVFTRADLLTKWEAGRISWLWPEPSHFDWGQFVLQQAIQFMLTLSVGLFIARRQATAQRRSRWAALLRCAIFGILLEGAQVFIFSRNASLVSAISNTIAMALGSSLWPFVSRHFNDQWTSRAIEARRWKVAWLLGLYSCALLFAARSTESALPAAQAAERLHDFWTPPFAALYWGSEFHAVHVTLRAALLFFPVGFACADLTTIGVPRWVQRTAIAAIAAIAVFAANLEFVQAWNPDSTLDVTMSLSYLAGAFAGSMVQRSLWACAMYGSAAQVNTRDRTAWTSPIDFAGTAGVSVVATGMCVCATADWIHSVPGG